MAPAAIDRLLSGDETLHQEARVEILSLGPSAMPDLQERFDGSSPEQKLSIIELATAIGKPDTILLDLLRAASHDEAPAVREFVAFRSVQCEELYPSLSPIIAPLIWDTDPQVQSAAIHSLAVFPGELSLREGDLELLMRTQSPLVMAAATSASLARASNPLRSTALEVLPDLVGQMMNPSPLIRAAVIIAIGKYGADARPAIPPLVGSLSYETLPSIRLQAAIALLRIDTPSSKKFALPALKRFCSDQDPTIARLAQEALRTAPTS